MSLWEQLQQTPGLPSPWQVALANLGRSALKTEMQAAEIASQESIARAARAAHLAGRQHEAKLAYEGAGYTFDVSHGPDFARTTTALASRRSPERKRGASRGPIRNAPDPKHVYDIGTARRQLGKTFGALQPWADPVFVAAGLLPVGQSISLDAGPTSYPRLYHIKIAKQPL